MGRFGADDETLLSELISSPPDQRASRLAETGEAADVLVRLADHAEHWAIDDLHRALEGTAVLVELADGVGTTSDRARVRRARAQALAYANRFDEALAAFGRSVELADSAGDADAAARARLSMVHALARLGRYDEAIEAGEAAGRSFRELGRDVWAAKAEANLGVVHRMRNDAAAALDHFNRARPILAGDPISLAQLDSNRAEALLELNRFSEAEAAFRSALAAFEGGSAQRAAAIVEGNLADLMSRQGRLDRALYHFERARRHFESDHAAGDLARIEAEQAEAYAGAGLLNQAADGYAVALPELDKHGLALEAARARAGQGRALTVLGRHDEADVALADAAERFTDLENTAGLATTRLLQGALSVARGAEANAAPLLMEALEHLQDRPAEAAVARYHLAALALNEVDLAAAERLIELAMDAANGFNLAPLLADLLHLRARLRTMQQRPAEALADLRSSVAEIERLRGSLQADRLRAAFVESRTAAFSGLVTALLDGGEDNHVGEAFTVCEHARSRGLLDLIAGTVHAASAVPHETGDRSAAPLVECMVDLHAELNALYSRLPETGDEPTVRRWREQVQGCEHALQTLESRLATTEGIGGVFAAPDDLPTVQGLLDSKTALVEYFMAGDELISFVVRRPSIHVHRGLAKRETLEEQIELAQFQIDRALSYERDSISGDSRLVDDARRELGALYDLLVRPLAGSLAGAERLVIVPHGPLHEVAFPTLHDGARYLIEDYEICHAPSASLLSHVRALPAAGRSCGSLIMGVPDDNAPGVEAEVTAAADALPGAEVYLGKEATWPRLREGGRNADIVHLACHGLFASDSPLASGLKLADRWLTVRDLFSLELDGSIVVLSGCDTGRSAVGGGDDLVGLMRGFFAAGASALLMTLWALHDDTAGNLVALVYRLWQNGRVGQATDLPAAVRAAQRDVMAAHPHPAFWGPFWTWRHGALSSP
jgi:CHAT domain-containing protein